MKTLRVLMVVPDLDVANGVATFAMNYLTHFSEKVSVDFALLIDKPSPYYEKIRERGGEVFILPPITKAKEHFGYCRRLLESGKYDIIHNNSLLKTFPLMWTAKKRGVSVRILHSHNSKLGSAPLKACIAPIFMPLLKKQANVSFACSEAAGKAMFGKKSFQVIPNAIDFNRFAFDLKKRSIIRNLMAAGNKTIIGSVGRLVEQKNPLFAVDLFCALKTRLPDAEYWWIGDGPLYDLVKKYAEKCGVANSFKLLGNKSDVDMYYNALDCLIMPSLFEGLPLTAIEAQVSGLPVVVSDHIPQKVKIGNAVAFLSLTDDGLAVWVDAILRALQQSERENTPINDKSEYNILNKVQDLENIYFCHCRGNSIV